MEAEKKSIPDDRETLSNERMKSHHFKAKPPPLLCPQRVAKISLKVRLGRIAAVALSSFGL